MRLACTPTIASVSLLSRYFVTTVDKLVHLHLFLSISSSILYRREAGKETESHAISFTLINLHDQFATLSSLVHVVSVVLISPCGSSDTYWCMQSMLFVCAIHFKNLESMRFSNSSLRPRVSEI